MSEIDSAHPLAWVISGASRGVGRALTELACAAGDLVVAGARQPETLVGSDRLVPVPLDVTRPDHCAAALRMCIETFGRVDAVASVAGVGLIGAVEETPDHQARNVVEANFWGTVNLTAASLRYMREQRDGHIVAVSSLTGRLAAAGNAFYAAAKFAVEGYAESLHAEMAEHGVRVTILEPGGIRTDWAGGSLQHAPSGPFYAQTVGRTREILSRANGAQSLSAEDVAQRIYQIVHERSTALRVVIGDDARARITAALQAELAALSTS